MATTTVDAPRRETIGPKSSTSVRIPSPLRAAVREKAASESLVFNTVVTELLEGYVRGVYVLPKVSKTYPEDEPAE